MIEQLKELAEREKTGAITHEQYLTGLRILAEIVADGHVLARPIHGGQG